MNAIKSFTLKWSARMQTQKKGGGVLGTDLVRKQLRAAVCMRVRVRVCLCARARTLTPLDSTPPKVQ